MSKKDVIKVEGTVTDLLPGTQFKVKVDDYDHTILCHLSGRMRQNRITVLVGDRVEVEMTPYDLQKGRISFRYK